MAFLSILTAVWTCYFAGFGLGWLMQSTSQLAAITTEQDNQEQQLKTEIRDLVSQVILETVGKDESLDMPKLVSCCPQEFQGGRAQQLWVQESYRLLQQLQG